MIKHEKKSIFKKINPLVFRDKRSDNRGGGGGGALKKIKNPE
jgi:hypothetical protein